MGKYAILSLILLTLSGCSFFQLHRQDVEQGNVIVAEQVRSLQVGMSEGEVKAIMGTPVLVNIFTPNRFEYVYTMQHGIDPRFQKRVTCIFEGGRLSRII